MQAFTTILATFAAISTVSGAPLVSRNTCGAAPSASSSQTPLAQPSNIQTALACQAACEANGSCQAFIFGFVDDAIKCVLYAVPAAQVPKQANVNLVVYDKACGSVPAVVPTSANPTGVNQDGSNSSSNSNSNNNNNNQQGQQSSPTTGQKLSTRNTCGAAPAGTNANQAPLSQPANINTQADCLAKCKANTSCKSFEFGTINGVKVCRLFAVAAASVPGPTSGQAFQVYDVGCSV